MRALAVVVALGWTGCAGAPPPPARAATAPATIVGSWTGVDKTFRFGRDGRYVIQERYMGSQVGFEWELTRGTYAVREGELSLDPDDVSPIEAFEFHLDDRGSTLTLRSRASGVSSTLTRRICSPTRPCSRRR